MGLSNQILAQLDVLERLHRLPDTVALTTSETAIFLRRSVSALESMHIKGTGPSYIQAGAMGGGANQKCFYEKADLLAWRRNNKVSSTLAAAIRKGQLFTSIVDMSKVEAFWIDDIGNVLGLVEHASIEKVIGWLGVFEITWLPLIDAAARTWNNLAEHRSFAKRTTDILSVDIQRVEAAVQATEISCSMDG